MTRNSIVKCVKGMAASKTHQAINEGELYLVREIINGNKLTGLLLWEVNNKIHQRSGQEYSYSIEHFDPYLPSAEEMEEIADKYLSSHEQG